MSPEEQQLMLDFTKPIHGFRDQVGLLQHPLIKKLKEASLSAEQLKQFCDVRYNAASEFVPLLERALELARADPSKAKLTDALEANLRDETGLDRKTGEKMLPPNAHSDWRKDFLDAIGVETTPERANHFPLYHFTADDDLPTLVGMLFAAEMIIPREDQRIYNSVDHAFPGVFSSGTDIPKTAQQIKNSLYLVDHIAHDAERHMPELRAAIIENMSAPEEMAKILAGRNRFFAERKGLYDHLHRALGFEAQGQVAVHAR